MRVLVTIVLLASLVSVAAQQETTVYLTLDQAPQAVFPGAQIERRDVPSTSELQAQIKSKLGRLVPSVWEPSYVTFAARQGDQLLGYAVIVDEIGKHRPFTLIVAATPDFKVKDAAVMVYRENRGGEITQRRFLAQYKGKRSQDPIRLDRDIVGISGATLSVQGANRAVHKALAVLELVYGR